MKELLKSNKIFIAIIILALIAALVVTVQRMGIESSNRSVDTILDYEETYEMAQQSDHDISWWLNEFRDMGVTKVGLREESLHTLTESEEPVSAKLVTEIRKDAYWMSNAPEDVLALINDNVTDDFDVLVIAESAEMFDFVNRAFTERYDADRVKSIRNEDGGYILIDGRVEDSLYSSTETIMNTDQVGFVQNTDMVSSMIMYLSLGLLPEKVKIIQNAGCTVEPRNSAYEGWNDEKFFNDIITQYEKMNIHPEYWILGDKVVPGYDEEKETSESLINYINENNITVGIVEDTTQRGNISPDGMEEVIEGTDYNVVRVFSVWPYIQYRYEYYGYDSYQEIENSLFRAVVERNINVIYYKPMKEKDNPFTYITDVQDYRDSFASLANRLERHNIEFGKAQASEPYQVPLLAKILIALGAGAACLMCLRAVLPVSRRLQYILLALGAVGVLGAYFVAPNAASLLTSFGASVALPCLAVLWMIYFTCEIRRKTPEDSAVTKLLVKGILVLVTGLIIAAAGAVMTAAPISSINYMLELDYFRGVKMSQLLPLALFALVFFLWGMHIWGQKTKTTLELSDIKWVLNYDIKVWLIAVAGIIGAAGMVYIARTGHETSIGASNFELLFRNLMEEILYARPRTKEFLVAFPSVMLFVYFMVRNCKLFSFVFGAAGVIGFTSVVNTFMHIRTPMELGFSRTAYSILFGIVLGVVYVLVAEVAYRIYRKWGNRIDA